FAPYIELYKRALDQFDHPLLPVGVHSLGLIAPTDEAARAAYWPEYKAAFESVARERGFAVPTLRQFENEVAGGALFVGSPETVAAKMATNIRLLGLSR